MRGLTSSKISARILSVGLLSVLLLSSFFSIFATTLASATSVYDALPSTTTLSIEQTAGSCSPVTDYTTHIADWYSQDSLWTSFDSTIGNTTGRDTARSVYNTVLTNQTGWAVSQITTQGANVAFGAINLYGEKLMVETFTAGANPQVNYGTDSSGNHQAYLTNTDNSPIYYVIVGYTPSGCNLQAYTGSYLPPTANTPSNNIIAYDVSNDAFTGSFGYGTASLYANANVVYPTGYTGSNIPPSLAPPDVPYYPNIELTVKGNAVSAVYTNNLKDYYSCGTVSWNMTKGTTPVQYDSKPHLSMTDTYTADNLSNDHYSLALWFDQTIPCASPPAGTVLKMTIISFNITGDSFIISSSDNSKSTCTIINGDQSCLAISPIKDCSTFGSDIVGGLGCQINNFAYGFIVSLRTLFTWVFVPDLGYLKSQVDNTGQTMTSHLGVGAYALTYIPRVLNSFSGGAITPIDASSGQGCSISTNANTSSNPDSFLRGSLIVNFCTLQQKAPGLWDLVTMWIRGLTVLGLVIAIYYKILNFFQGGVGHHKERG